MDNFLCKGVGEVGSIFSPGIYGQCVETRLLNYWHEFYFYEFETYWEVDEMLQYRKHGSLILLKKKLF